MLLYSAFWKVNKSSAEAERPEAWQYYLSQLIYRCKWKKMCNLRNARRNWRCFSMRGCSKGWEHSSIILQTKALIIEEGNAAETLPALHVRHLFKRKLGPARRIFFKQPRLKLIAATSFSSWDDNSPSGRLPSSPVMLVCQFDLKAKILHFAALSAALFRMWLRTSRNVMHLYLYALVWSFWKTFPISAEINSESLYKNSTCHFYGKTYWEHFIRLSLTF